jgi:hypothetical protein
VIQGFGAGRRVEAMTGRIPHLGLIWLFVLLSMADLALTGELLNRSQGRIYESNPVANWWLAYYGWPGFVAFKLAIVLFIVGLVMIISRLRPTTARRFLAFACMALTAVVLYSGNLLWAHTQGSGPFERERLVENKRDDLDKKLSELQIRLHVRVDAKSKRNQVAD